MYYLYFLTFFGLFLPSLLSASVINSDNNFVGGKSCKSCHKKEYELWLDSDHNKAMDHATNESVLGDFNNKTLTTGKNKYRMFKKEGSFYMSLPVNGENKEYEINYTFGYRPIQQYMTTLENGKIQVLPITWDNQKKEWFDISKEVYPNEVIDSDNWLYWLNQGQNWNGMCASCHSTNVSKNYDYKTDSYNTKWSEINVSCEACHGAASKHLKWAEQKTDGIIKNKGFSFGIREEKGERRITTCAYCHARRSLLGDYKYEDENTYNHMIPSETSSPNYFNDGQVKEEDFVYGSFKQSLMYKNGVSCEACHDSHSTRLLREGNKVCTICHEKDTYDIKEHHKHDIKK